MLCALFFRRAKRNSLFPRVLCRGKSFLCRARGKSTLHRRKSALQRVLFPAERRAPPCYFLWRVLCRGCDFLQSNIGVRCRVPSAEQEECSGLPSLLCRGKSIFLMERRFSTCPQLFHKYEIIATKYIHIFSCRVRFPVHRVRFPPYGFLGESALSSLLCRGEE